MAKDESGKVIKLDAAAAAKLDKRRRRKDKVTNGLIAGGGIFVLIAITAIFFELLRVSLPLFTGGGSEEVNHYKTAAVTPNTALLQIDEHNETGMRLLPNAQLEFFNIKTNKPIKTFTLPVPAGVKVSKVKRGTIVQHHVGLGLSNGQLVVFQPEMQSQGLGKDRVVTVNVKYPYGNTPLTVNDAGTPLTIYDIQDQSGELAVMAVLNGQLVLQTYTNEAGGDEGGLSLAGSAFNIEGEDTTDAVFTRTANIPIAAANNIKAVEIGQGGRRLYAVAKNGKIEVMRHHNGQVTPHQSIDTKAEVSAVSMLQGDISLLIGDTKGNVHQWFNVKDTKDDGTETNTLTKIRSFHLAGSPITTIEPEVSRKGIVAGDETGNVGYFYTTSNRTLDRMKMGDKPITALNMSAHGDGLLVGNTTENSFWKLDAEHPEFSTSAMWGKVWYESYPKPNYTWQSSAGNVDYEPKISLMPLTFGTLKAAFWAMLLSAPLAIAGAMYTAVFMSPVLRTKVKPALELMEALPTVILGFLAGLWLAPIVTQNLPAVFILLIVAPIVILLAGFLWVQMPLERRNSIPAGITPAVLVLPLIIAGVITFLISDYVETKVFSQFSGSMVEFVKADTIDFSKSLGSFFSTGHFDAQYGGLGIEYVNLNALIVGLMMGFAVIPTIFSIAEDALFAVPRHLTNGSLALGATPWQTMTRVILPTASPGIFSALMIGLGRAVGETMIVLMATGNTPIMDLSLFNGMRTLSANVAVEMGEAELGSTHYRVLFLSALVLFILTFFLNTLAEVVRNRLRKKYGSL